MFLLIPRPAPAKDSRRSIYIPLCFYLYSECIGSIICQIKFTFHYVSTYTLWSGTDTADTRYIYIPLCFYLYCGPAASWSWCCRIYIIYIPLCFYLYEWRLWHQELDSRIYIPLCFYLYQVQRAPAVRFRLHLHSTMFLLIRNIRRFRIIICAFTFHYVSTYTRIFSSFNLYYFPLSKLSTSRFAPSLSPPFFIYVLLSVIFLQKYGLCRLPVF